MKKIHKFVLKSYVGPLVLTFFISMFVLLMQFLWKYIDDLVGKGLEMSVITELLSYASFGLIPMALPLAILLASLMTFGNLGENYELIAMKSAGVSLLHIMSPLVILTIIISVGAFFFSNNILPYTNLKTASLLYDIKRQRPELNIKEGIFNNDIENYTIRIGKKNRETNMLYNFMLYDHSENRGNCSVTVSDSAEMYVTKDEKYIVLTLYHGHSYQEMEEKNRDNVRKQKFPHRQSKFDKQRLIFDTKSFELDRTDDELFKHNYQMKNLSELNYAIDSLNKSLAKRKTYFFQNILSHNFFRSERMPLNDSVKQTYDLDTIRAISVDSIYNSLSKTQKANIIAVSSNYASSTKSYIKSTKQDFVGKQRWIRKHEIEWHRKFSLSFACFIFFFIGAPLGAIIRKGGLGMPVVVSVVFFIVYYIISLTGEKFVRESIIAAVEGMWISSFILLPLGIFLTYKAANDSVIMNINTYLGVFNKIKKLFSSEK
ncbi:MAG: permease [Bacteroidia bacterium]|nr:MAG: permease [Bacteroidia bacterium]